MTWDVEGGGVSVGGLMLPGVHARRGGVVGRTGVVPRAGSLSGVLDGDGLGIGVDVTLLDDADTVWTGSVRNVEQRHDQQLNALRYGMRATGPIADLVAVQPGPATRVYKGITVDVALGHLLDAVGWSAARRDIGASARTLGWWWLAGNASPWSEILRLVRTAGPRARLFEDVMGRIVFRDTALPAVASRTFYGRRGLPLLSSALPVVTRLQADDAGRDRVINRARLPYAVAPVGELVNTSATWGSYDVTTEAPSAEAEVAAPAGNVLLISAFGAGASDGTPLPTPSAPSRGVAMLAERDHSAVHGTTFATGMADVSVMTEDATIAITNFPNAGGPLGRRVDGSARNSASGLLVTVGSYSDHNGATRVSHTQPGAVSMSIPTLPGNAVNVQVAITALTVYSIETRYSYTGLGGQNIQLWRATSAPPDNKRAAFVTVSRRGSTITVTPMQTTGTSTAVIATNYAYDVTVRVTWQLTMAPWTASAVSIGYVKDGLAATYAADMSYAGAAGGITRRASANLAALRLINAGEPRVVEVGDQVGEGTVLLAVAVSEGRLDTTAVLAPSAGWLSIAGAPTLRGGSVTPAGSRRLLWLATRTVAARGPVPAITWTHTGRTNAYTESLIIAIPPEARVIWQEDGTRDLPANRGIVVLAPLAAPAERILDLIAGVDYQVLSGNVVSAGIGFQGEGPSVQITLTAGPGGATIAGLQLRGSLVSNAGRQVTAEDGDSVTAHGSQELPASQVWQWLEETQAQALADAWVAYSASPRRAWEVVLDGSRGAITRQAALAIEITDRVRTRLDDDFDIDGEVIGISHQITEAAGLLTTRVAMLAAASTAPVTIPGTPTSLTVTPASSTMLRAAWTAPSSGGAQVTSYAVDYRAGTSGAWTTVTGVTEPTFTLTGLMPSTAYEVRVAARNRVGLGDYTAPVTATTLAPAVPGVPTSVVATPGVTTIAVSWSAPASGGAASSYSVRHRAGTSGAWTTVTGVTGLTRTITGLTPSTAYQVEVQAVNAAGASAWVRVTVTTLAPAVPGVPTSVVATPGVTTIAVSWSAPASGGAASSYSVRHRAGTSGAWTTVTGVTGLTRTITGLTPSTAYQVEVQAVNAGGASAWVRVTVTTLATLTAPGVPTSVVATPGVTTIAVSWSAPASGGAASSYSVRHRAGTSGAWTTVTGVTGLTRTITGLTPSTAYQVEVQAVNAAGASAWVRVTVTTLAPAVITFEVEGNALKIEGIALTTE